MNLLDLALGSLIDTWAIVGSLARMLVLLILLRYLLDLTLALWNLLLLLLLEWWTPVGWTELGMKIKAALVGMAASSTVGAVRTLSLLVVLTLLLSAPPIGTRSRLHFCHMH